MHNLLKFAEALPRRSLAAGERLIAHGEQGDVLYVLLEGTLQVERGDVAITTITEPGACIGEMSLLLEGRATSDVVALEPAVVAVADDARRRIGEDAELTLVLAQMLASRLHVMTTYLADLKHQYADHEGGLGMVHTVLGSLSGHAASTRLASERDPHPEY